MGRAAEALPEQTLKVVSCFLPNDLRKPGFGCNSLGVTRCHSLQSIATQRHVMTAVPALARVVGTEPAAQATLWRPEASRLCQASPCRMPRPAAQSFKKVEGFR